MGERQAADAGRQASRRLQALVRGRVQGVYFRQFVWSQAGRLGVTGWVCNGEDGRTVQVEAEGPADALKRLLDLLREGPPGARVDNVEAAWSDEPRGYTTFEVRF
jgi:acylphosphatase